MSDCIVRQKKRDWLGEEYLSRVEQGVPEVTTDDSSQEKREEQIEHLFSQQAYVKMFLKEKSATKGKKKTQKKAERIPVKNKRPERKYHWVDMLWKMLPDIHTPLLIVFLELITKLDAVDFGKGHK